MCRSQKFPQELVRLPLRQYNSARMLSEIMYQFFGVLAGIVNATRTESLLVPLQRAHPTTCAIVRLSAGRMALGSHVLPWPNCQRQIDSCRACSFR